MWEKIQSSLAKISNVTILHPSQFILYLCYHIQAVTWGGLDYIYTVDTVLEKKRKSHFLFFSLSVESTAGPLGSEF